MNFEFRENIEQNKKIVEIQNKRRSWTGVITVHGAQKK